MRPRIALPGMTFDERERCSRTGSARTARRGRGASGGAAARRAARSGGGPGRSSPTSSARSSVYEVLDEEGLALIEAQCRHGAGRDRHRFPRRPGSAGDVEGSRRRREGRARAFPEGALPRSLLKTAPPIFTQHARNPERSVRDRRQRHRLRAGLRPALRARPRRQPPLRARSRISAIS